MPRLGGKIDLIPGRHNTLWLQTEEPVCTSASAPSTAARSMPHMLLRVVVDTPEEFEHGWPARRSRPWTTRPSRRTEAAFLAESCVNCHRVRGTSAVGNYAPDLTHLMSRATLASGMIALDDAENLRALGPRSAGDQARLPDAGVRTERTQSKT